MLVVPFRLSGRVLGVALNYTLGEMYTITQEDVELASGVASSVALAVEMRGFMERHARDWRKVRVYNASRPACSGRTTSRKYWKLFVTRP